MVDYEQATVMRRFGSREQDRRVTVTVVGGEVTSRLEGKLTLVDYEDQRFGQLYRGNLDPSKRSLPFPRSTSPSLN